MRKKDLELIFESLLKLDSPKNDLEQYTTPAPIAADIIHTAYMYNDIMSKTVADLGCGNGVFGIGAALLGAKKVYAVDIDPAMISIARKNATTLNLKINFIQKDIQWFNIKVDTIIQNPPFGAQKKGADLSFFEKIKLSNVTYMLYHKKSIDFLHNKIAEYRYHVDFEIPYFFKIPYLFPFHKKEKKYIEVMLLRIEREDK